MPKKQHKIILPIEAQEFVERSLTNRFGTLALATTNLIAYYVDLGDTQEEAEIKVGQISNEIRIIDGGSKFDYILGNIAPLLNSIDLVSEITYPFFDNLAKTQIKTDLHNV